MGYTPSKEEFIRLARKGNLIIMRKIKRMRKRIKVRMMLENNRLRKNMRSLLKTTL